MMSDGQLTAFCVDLDTLAEKWAAVVDADSAIERIVIGIAEVLERDRQAQTDELVRSLLEAAVEKLRHAAMDYYVSFK